MRVTNPICALLALALYAPTGLFASSLVTESVIDGGGRGEQQPQPGRSRYQPR